MRVAALDLGSNSFHLLVAEARPDGAFVPVLREKEMLRLGDVVARSGRIGPEAADAALASVRRLRALAEAAGADEVVACATSAVRRAADGAELVGRFAAEAGVAVKVISGEEEAGLIFEAVRASVLIEPGPGLCLDLGGGSLEVMVGDAAGLWWAASAPLGVAQLAPALGGGDPPHPADLRRLRKRLRAALAPVAAEVARHRPRTLIATSGTFVDLGRMATALDTGAVPASVNQLEVGRPALEAVHRQVVALSTSQRRRLPGLESRRADLAPAGSLLALVAMEVFGFDELTLGEWALREGMVLDALGRRADAAGGPRTIRQESVLDLCRRCRWREDHARQVARLATRLFDQTAALHGLSEGHRELLEYGALLHDIGEHVSAEAHHKHSAYLIRHGRLRGFPPHEVNVLATLGRYHRQGDPKASFEPFGALDADQRAVARRLTSLLRLADGLDRGHAAAVEDVRLELHPGRVDLVVEAGGDVELELWALRRKRALFEDEFGVRLAVAPAEPPTAAAAGWGQRRGA